MSGWIGVDLDGTLAFYDGWKDGEIGEPIPKMATRVRRWLSQGKDVRIFTARVGVGDSTNSNWVQMAEDQRLLIQDWTKKHFGIVLPVTATKTFDMIELWDDRAISVIPNTGEIGIDKKVSNE